jgi:hypothetical protein
MTVPDPSTTTGASAVAAAAKAAPFADWQANPFLHADDGRIYNPLTDRTLAGGDGGYQALVRVLAGEAGAADLPLAERETLGRDGWLVPPDATPESGFYLKYVSLEAHTVCNQSCYFCPVSVAPREAHYMPTEMYERIVGELAAFRDTIEGVAMINYNEPTADRRFVDQVRTLKEAGLPPAVLTNGTGLTPDRVDAILALGGLKYLSVNLSTLDRERYRRDRGKGQLDLVLRNLDAIGDRPLAEEMEIVVLGTGDADHRSDEEEIRQRFAGSRFKVSGHVVMDRAGLLDIGSRPGRPHPKLRGCDNLGSRPLQHLHITPQGRCVLCCEDYNERYVVGDLTRSSVEEVLTGPEIATLRRWIYGLEEAPGDFICRRCIFARTA